MADETLKAAAKAGEPKAIEALLNQSFGNEGITARVLKSGERLRITLRSSSLPDRRKADVVKKGLASIKPEGIVKVSLRGEQIGGGNWTTEWELSGSPKKTAPVITSEKKQKWYLHPYTFIAGGLGVLFLLGSVGSLLEEPAPPPPEPPPQAVAPAPEPTPTPTPEPIPEPPPAPPWEPTGEGWRSQADQNGRPVWFRKITTGDCGIYDYCLNYEVITEQGCSSLYVQASQANEAGQNVGWTNDTVQGLRPKETGLISLGATERGTFRLDEVNCR